MPRIAAGLQDLEGWKFRHFPTGIWENINHQLADLFSTYCHINSHQGSSLTRATCHFFSERAKCKSSLNLPAPGTRSFLPGQQISFFLPGYHAQLHDLKGFGKFWETLFTPKEWSLSKKGPKEGERVVARGQFHERVGETSVHWLPPGVGITQNLFLFLRTGHLKISLGLTQILYSKFHGLLKLIFHTNQYNGA